MTDETKPDQKRYPLNATPLEFYGCLAPLLALGAIAVLLRIVSVFDR